MSTIKLTEIRMRQEYEPTRLAWVQTFGVEYSELDSYVYKNIKEKVGAAVAIEEVYDW